MLGAALVVAGCGQSSEQESVAKKETAAPSPHTGKGVGPIDHVDVASLDSSHAAEGAKVFEAKCTACHKLDERYIGPALSGVTERRKPEWIMNMILNPDVMVKEDDTAKALLAEYIAPMTNQNLTQEEAKLVLAYLLHNDGSKAAE
jgi:mono/diheme cytochrome c family protein